MCGICGFTGAENHEVLEKMLSALRHRGPDAQGIWQSADKNVHFGHRRLSILDLAGGGQPMSTADGRLTITYNGEIYNFRELRGRLEAMGHHFRSDHSDTEVLLHGYRQWGVALPSYLNGMWAFVIHDMEHHRLFASRDRFGKKPLYYFYQQGIFVFASELTSLRQHPACPTQISKRALMKLFAYGYIPAPQSLLSGVEKLPAGHNLIYEISDHVIKINRYWRYELEPAKPPAHPREIDELAEAFVQHLQKAVERRMVADVPVGVFLSGGIDSSTVAALALRTASQPVATFTIGFTEPSFDESRYAAITASAIGSSHHVKTLSIDRARDLIPQVLQRLDEPMGDASILPTAMLSAFAREKVTVALGGDGSDELLAGYDPFAALGKAALYERLVPHPVHRAISLLVGKMPVSHHYMSFDFKLKRTLRGLEYAPCFWLPVWMAPLTLSELSDLFAQTIDLEDIYSEAITIWNSCTQKDILSKVIQFYVNLYLQDDILTKTDRASMMYSLEVRSPFLDIEVIDFIRRLHPSLLYRHSHRKYLLRYAVRKLIPSAIISRPKKGFGIPIGTWLQTGHLSVDLQRLPALLQHRPMEKFVLQHKTGKSDQRAALWIAIVLAHANIPN